MPHQAQFADVRRLIGDFGPRAMLISVTESPRPHVVTAMVRIDGDHLVADVGPRTRANVVDRPGVALVWHPRGDDEYQLIIDGMVDDVGGPDDRDVTTLRIAVVGGILHRLAGLPDGPPTCRSLAAEAPHSNV